MGKETTKIEKTEESQENVKKLRCGIVMPIAKHPDYPSNHWNDVLDIITEAINETDFEPSLVSASLDIGLIQERIVNNLYSNEIVICDVSSKNPNVMFELGLRLAFDKPTIIIKDEKSNYSFDIGGIEHLSYPSSLRFSEITKFKEDLIKRVNASYQKSLEDLNYSPFLKSFGTNIIPTKINQKDISETEFIMDSLIKLQSDVSILRKERDEKVLNSNEINVFTKELIAEHIMTLGKHIESKDDLVNIQNNIMNLNGVRISAVLINQVAKEIGFSDFKFPARGYVVDRAKERNTRL